MQSKLFFGVGIPYNQTMNDNLQNISALKFWDRDMKHYVYIFELEQKKEVEKLINEEIVIDGIKQYSGDIIKLEPWKGKSTFEVIEKAEYYETISYQKEKGGKPQKQVKIIMKNIVVNAWECVKELKLNESYGARYVAQKIVRKLKLERFLNEKNELIWSKFIGIRTTEDEAYFTFYQTPMRILEYYGLIDYSKNIIKKKENWEEQPKLR